MPDFLTHTSFMVAPLVGAWIEILKCKNISVIVWVAPLVGAWIEIKFLLVDDMIGGSRSPRGSVD